MYYYKNPLPFIDEIEDVYVNSENKLCTTKYL